MFPSSFPEVRVVGMHFRGSDAKQIAAYLNPGEVLRLEREPHNVFDGNAIKVFFEAIWIGYLEAPQAAWIAPHMDEGAVYEAIVDRVEDVENARGKINSFPIVEVRLVE